MPAAVPLFAEFARSRHTFGGGYYPHRHLSEQDGKVGMKHLYTFSLIENDGYLPSHSQPLIKSF